MWLYVCRLIQCDKIFIMKSKIEAYFKHDRTYRNGVNLILEFSPNIAIKRQLNVQPESSYMTGIVFEELRRLAGITRQQLDDILQLPVAPVQPEQAVEPAQEPVQDQESEDDPAQEKKGRRKK
jgi:hypothetical protein